MITLKEENNRLILIQNNLFLVKILLLHIPIFSYIFFYLFCLIHFRGFSDAKLMIFITIFLCIILSLKVKWKKEIFINKDFIIIKTKPLKKIHLIKNSEIIKIKIVRDTIRNKDYQLKEIQEVYNIKVILKNKEYNLCSSEYYAELKLIEKKLYEYLGDVIL